VNTIKTKKLLVAYDPENAAPISGDFLVPINDSAGVFFFGLRSKKPVRSGAMVYIGRELTMNDVFAKLVDTGRKIENVDATVKSIEAYLRMLQDYKIGNILSVAASPTEVCGFQLQKLANSPSVVAANLP